MGQQSHAVKATELRNKIYYGIKPLLPWPVRICVRRWFAQLKRPRVNGTWPIMPGSEQPPGDWGGWPDGKKFALVLTHDVERREGIENCRQLMHLEMGLGLRSSFNFVPEGNYALARELREELVQNGFEVGVHDMRHDGKLYWTRGRFVQNAKRINHYIKEWGANGFRSGFMLHKMDWLHDLHVEYDSSTFDTDPFEPQPDGVGTIFPFWVPRPAPLVPHPHSTPRCLREGYVELPYTLPQDSTLFLLFRERSADIWFEKLDWIAKQGGMALMITHPDYMSFNNGTPRRSDTYKAELYTGFLTYVLQKYKHQCWQGLPKDVARLCKDNRAAKGVPDVRFN